MNFLKRLDHWWNGPDLRLTVEPLDKGPEDKTDKAQSALQYVKEQADALEIEASVILRRRSNPDVRP